MEPSQPLKRTLELDKSDSDFQSQEKQPKLSDHCIGNSTHVKSNGALLSPEASQHCITTLVDHGDFISSGRKQRESSESEQEEKGETNSGVQQPISDSQETLLLSDRDDDEEEINPHDATVPLSQPDTEQVRNLEQADRKEDVDKDSVPCSPSLQQLWKDTSVAVDAGTITNIIPDADTELVLETLVKHRANPDRLNIATAAALDQDRLIEPASDPDRLNIASTAVQDQDRLSELVSDADRSREPATGSGEHSDAHTTQKSTSGGGSSLYEDVKRVVNRVKAVQPDMNINPTMVYMLLEQNEKVPCRVEFVCNELLANSSTDTKDWEASSSDDIFNEAMKLNTEFPQVDASAIYELLEKAEAKDRFQLVRQKLQTHLSSTVHHAGCTTSAQKPTIPKDDSVSNDPLVKNDPVFRDMRIISKMFPDKDQNELYALVEAHYYKSDRVQIVIEELLRVERNSQDSASLPVCSDTSVTGSDAHRSTPVHTVERELLGGSHWHLQDAVSQLRDIFPDCDPNYIFERLEACRDKADSMKVLVAEMFEKKDYPRLNEVLEKQTKVARKQRLHAMKFSIEEFLAKFPDPAGTFADSNKEMKDSYRAHVSALLRHDFPEFKQSYMTSVTEKHHHHLLPLVREVEAVRAEILVRGGQSKKMRTIPKEEPLVYPDEPDELFFYELWYLRNEERVKGHFEQQAAERQAKVEEARANNELYECNCCYDDECLFEDMNVCSDGHLFCRQCIARSAEAAFGEGKTTFPCLTGTCEQQIPLSVLKEVLPSSMFSKVLRKLQEEEVRQAGIADLVECPFCSFATIMPDPEDRVFHCLNPECLKDSCRLCREPNHVPLRCEEVERQNETDMRTYIEKRVTEAMLRKCHRCDKRFVKDVGCNKMTCICGATSCYVCREPDIDYSHFNENNCNEGDMNKLHQQEMERAAREAKEEYLRDHPEASDINLKYDPAQHIQKNNSCIFDNDVYDDEGDEASSAHSDSIMDSDEEDEAYDWYY